MVTTAYGRYLIKFSSTQNTFCNFYIFHVGMAHWTDMKLKNNNYWKNCKNWKAKILWHFNLKII